MKKTNISILILAALVFAACSREDNFDQPSNPIQEEALIKDPLTPQQVNAKIDQALETNGSFDWKDASNNLLWSAVHHGNDVVSIGFGTSKNDFERSKSPDNAKIQNELLQLIMAYENSTLDKTLITADAYLNTMDVVISRQETIIALRKNNMVRYVEPGDYKYFQVNAHLERSNDSSGGSGCGFEASTLNTADYTTITDGVMCDST